MSTKYQNLPDIDTSAPDVYETPDPDAVGSNVNTTDTDPEFEDTDEYNNSDIIRAKTSVKSVSDRLRRTVVDAEGVDFSDTLTVRQKKTYKTFRYESTTETEFELLPHQLGLKETPAQRLKRLMIEVNELGEDIEKSIKDANQAEKKQDISNPSILLNQLTNLETQLETYNARLTSSSTINSSQSAAQGGSISNLNTKQLLMSHLKSFREGAVSEKSVSKALEGKQSLDANGVTYELYYSPDTSNLVRSTKMSELDQRITLLEKIFGIGGGSMGNEVPSTPIVPLLNRLDHHLSLLTNPRNLDILTRKLKQLTLEMEKVAELQKRAAHMGSGGSSDKDGNLTIRKEMESKINHLFNITAQVDPLIHLAPQLLTRLSQLHNLHLEATSFSEGLKKLGNDVDKCGKGVDEVKSLAETLEKSIQENALTVQKNITVIEDRLKDVIKKVEVVSSKISKQ